jgi:hypothetical protein
MSINNSVHSADLINQTRLLRLFKDLGFEFAASGLQGP